MLEKLKEEVFRANLALVKHGLVVLTWGNVSAIDRDSGLIVIKPSGVEYDTMQAQDMVVVDFDGNIIEGHYRPSSDTPTHLEIYRAFASVGAVVHTHSRYATAWAQAGREIPCAGTTHADYYYGNIPCTRDMTREEVDTNYELNTGKLIAERFLHLNCMQTPGILVKNHGPFTWGKECKSAVHHAVVLEEIAMMAINTITLNARFTMNEELIRKHFNRKHGKNAYYGQQ